MREVTTGAAITGNMTLTTDPNATQLQTINNGTTGNVIIPNAGITLSGTPAVLVEALTGSVATAGSAKISGTVTISGANPDSAQLKTINDAIDGAIVVPSKAVALSGTAAVLVESVSR